MTHDDLIRYGLLLTTAGFLLLCIALPLVRLRLREGVWGLKGPRTSVDGVVHTGLRGLILASPVWVALNWACDPERLCIWPTPTAVAVAGLIVGGAGLLIVALAQAQMGASWRIGIDDEPTGLVERGLFGLSRNPIYVGVLTSLLGLVLLTPSPWTVCLFGAALLVIALQARLEEQHLLAMHGDAFRRYAARVGRFVPGVGRLR